MYRLCIGDNGKGYDANFDIDTADSLGLQLINSLSEQLMGSVQRDTTQKGTHYCVSFQELPSSSQRFSNSTN